VLGFELQFLLTNLTDPMMLAFDESMKVNAFAVVFAA
jgi:hypothetical protein